MSEIQPENATQPDWAQLAAKLGVQTEEEAKAKAFEIASYIAEVDRSKTQTLLVKKGDKFEKLTLKK